MHPRARCARWEETGAGLARTERAAPPTGPAPPRAAARALVDEERPQHTFHTDRGFSFGEGWYLAAASVLGGVAIQIEPGGPRPRKPSGSSATRTWAIALRPHRPRPRANKRTTDVVARAFRADPLGAQRKLRTAFLGDAPIGQAVSDWIDPRLGGCRDRPKVLLWIRDGAAPPRSKHGRLRGRRALPEPPPGRA